MIKQIPLFFDKLQNRYFYVGECECLICQNKIKQTVIIKHSWSKKNSEIGLFCLGCFNKVRTTTGIIGETRGAKLVLERPKGAFPVINYPPSLCEGKNDESVFSMAEKTVEGEIVNDYTRLAGRESWEGSQIGLIPEKVDDKQQILDNSELDKRLLKFRGSKIPKTVSLDYLRGDRKIDLGKSRKQGFGLKVEQELLEDDSNEQ